MTPEKKGPKLKLLVPFDFNHKSELALEFALKYSRNINADVYLFHVFEASTSDYRRLDRLNEEYLERMKQIVVAMVGRLAQEGIAHAVEGVHRRIANGKPWAEILKMAGGISADIIIMGAPSSNDFKRLIIKAPCTVVLVKDKDPAFVMV